MEEKTGKVLVIRNLCGNTVAEFERIIDNSDEELSINLTEFEQSLDLLDDEYVLLHESTGDEIDLEKDIGCSTKNKAGSAQQAPGSGGGNGANTRMKEGVIWDDDDDDLEQQRRAWHSEVERSRYHQCSGKPLPKAARIVPIPLFDDNHDVQELTLVIKSEIIVKKQKQAIDALQQLVGVSRKREFIAAIRPRLRCSRDFWWDVIVENPKLLQFAPKLFRGEKELILGCVCRVGRLLEHATADLRADPDVVLSAILQDGAALEFASKDCRADRELVLSAVGKHGFALQHADPELRNDGDLVYVAVRRHRISWRFASAQLRAGFKSALDFLQHYQGPTTHADTERLPSEDSDYTETKNIKEFDTRHGRNVVRVITGDEDALHGKEFSIYSDSLLSLAQVEQIFDLEEDEYELQDIDGVHQFSTERRLLEIPEGIDTIQLVVKDDVIREKQQSFLRSLRIAAGDTADGVQIHIEDMRPRFRDDKDFFLALLNDMKAGVFSFAQDLILFTSKRLRNEKSVMLAAVCVCGNWLRHASNALREDKEIVTAAVSSDGRAIRFALGDVRGDESVAFLAVREDGRALEYVSEMFPRYRELVMTAVRTRGNCLKYASMKMRDDREIVLEAVMARDEIHSRDALLYASNELRCDKEIALAAVKQYGSAALMHVGDVLRGDDEMAFAATKADSETMERNNRLKLSELARKGK